MQIILMEKVVNLGGLGDVVKVKDGYARNFLIPQGKAKRVTPENLAAFEIRRAELEKAQAEKHRKRPPSSKACWYRSPASRGLMAVCSVRYPTAMLPKP